MDPDGIVAAPASPTGTWRRPASTGPDGERWRRLMQPLLEHSQELVDFILSGQRSLPRSLSVPALLASRMLVHGTALAPRCFSTEEARSLLTGVAAHAVGRLPSLASGAVAALLGHLAHVGGWPVPQSGSARIADALAADIVACGGTFHTSHHVTRLEELPRAKTVLLDVSPKAFARIAADRLPLRYRRGLARFRYGPAAAKVDFLVSEPIPWANPAVGQAATVHLGGTQAEMYRAETAAAAGIRPEEPFVLLVDPAAPEPDDVPYGPYAHVSNGDAVDPAATVTACIERHRALCAGIHRHGHPPAGDQRRTVRGVQPELRGGRHRRGSHDPLAVPHASRTPLRSVPHPAARRVPVLGVNAARTERPRYVGTPCRAVRPAPRVRRTRCSGHRTAVSRPHATRPRRALLTPRSPPPRPWTCRGRSAAPRRRSPGSRTAGGRSA